MNWHSENLLSEPEPNPVRQSDWRLVGAQAERAIGKAASVSRQGRREVVMLICVCVCVCTLKSIYNVIYTLYTL